MLNVHVQLDNDDSDSTNSIGLDENLVLKLVRKLQPKLVSVLITVTDIALWGNAKLPATKLVVSYFPSCKLVKDFC